MMSGRGRGARNGAVSIKVERVVRNKDRQGGGSVYEDEVVYVTEGPRRRGRPRTRLPVVTPRPQPKPPQRYPRSDEVIYVSAMRGRPQYTPSRPCVVHQPRPLSVCAAVCSRPVRCVVTGLASAAQTIVNIPKPVLTLGVQKPTEPRRYWPADLQGLVVSWDALPERRTRDVVKWFQTSKAQPPGIVEEIQEMWASMPETWEEKVDLALEWLREMEPSKNGGSVKTAANGAARPTNGVDRSTNGVDRPTNGFDRPTNGVDRPTNGIDRLTNGVASTSNVGLSHLESVLPPVSRAKVLVEAQPNPIQNCGQWSAMAENGGSRNH